VQIGAVHQLRREQRSLVGPTGTDGVGGAKGDARALRARQREGPLLEELGLKAPQEEAVGARSKELGEGALRQPCDAAQLLFGGGREDLEGKGRCEGLVEGGQGAGAVGGK
jgi:hypothetical protein